MPASYGCHHYKLANIYFLIFDLPYVISKNKYINSKINQKFLGWDKSSFSDVSLMDGVN